MAVFTNLPTLSIDYIKSGKMSFDVIGSALNGGRDGEGRSVAIETAGGGVLVGAYENCFAQRPGEHVYVNWLAARLNGGFRFINVPILNDWSGPFPVIGGQPTPVIRGIRHSDGTRFSDGAGYSQVTVFGQTATDAPLGAGQIVVDVFGTGRDLRAGDWFSIDHPASGWRAYRAWEVSAATAVTVAIGGTNWSGRRFTLSLDRPLRQAVAAGTAVRFARPLCVMRFPVGFSLPWQAEGFWQSSPTLQFVEAF